ncbi:MAG TPA: hypothetical protein VKZ74_08790 [Natronosporangium sp.]|nr:hypothetical protein [Natronosporangium sp.]
MVPGRAPSATVGRSQFPAGPIAPALRLLEEQEAANRGRTDLTFVVSDIHRLGAETEDGWLSILHGEIRCRR